MKNTTTKYYFKIKFDSGLTEYANCTSSKPVNDIIENFLDVYNTPAEWAKGNILESIVPTTEMEYLKWSLAVKQDFHIVTFPN